MPRETALPPILRQDGSLDEASLDSQFGLGRAEAMQIVRFGEYEGTVAEMLSHPRCPVGGILRDVYKGKGIDGVLETFAGLKVVYRTFEVNISPETIKRERIKKNLIAHQS